MTKRKTWYQVGFDEGQQGGPADPPMTPGHRSHSEYMAGFADGQLQAERDSNRSNERA